MLRHKVTAALREASTTYLAKRGYSVHPEVGLVSRGRLKADLWAFTTSLTTCLIEIKSCWQDYATDKKWNNYSAYAHKKYMCISHMLHTQHPELASALRDQGWGLLVLGADGRITCKVNAKHRECAMDFIKPIVIKLAYRNGKTRHTTRRRKILLT
jgi:hypothetical protein